MAPVLWIGHPRAGAQGPLPEPSHFAGAEQETGSSLPLMPACKTHYLRQSGQAGTGTMPLRLATSATGTGTASAPNPKDESGTQARGLPSRNRPASAPSPSSAAPKTSLNGSQRWQTSRLWSRFGAVWGSRLGTLAKTPTIMCDLPKVPLRDKKKSLVGDSPHGQSGHFRRGTPHDSHHHQDSKSGWPGPPEPPCGGRPPRFPSACLLQAGGLRGQLQALRAGLPNDLRRSCEEGPQLYPLRNTLRNGRLGRGGSHPQTYSWRNGLPKIPRGHRP